MLTKIHNGRATTRLRLKNAIAQWAGHYKFKDQNDSRIYRQFYFMFGIDIATAQTLNTKRATELLNTLLTTEIL